MQHNPEWDDDPYIKGSPDPNPNPGLIVLVLLILFALAGYLLDKDNLKEDCRNYETSYDP